MLKNYLLIAWRQILKNKGYTAINVLGLVTGLCVFVFGSLLVRYEHAYDTFFDKSDRIFTAGSVFNPAAGIGVDMSDSVYSAVGPLIEADIPEVEAVARVINREFLMSVGEDDYYETLRFADPEFLDVFDLAYVSGDARALRDPNGLALSRAQAIKFFGRADAVGEMVSLDHKVELRVTAVFENLPISTHFGSSIMDDNQRLNLVAPLSALGQATDWDLQGDWNDLSMGNNTYMLFPEGTSLRQVQQGLDIIWKTHMPEGVDEFVTRMSARRLVDANTVMWDMIGMPVLESVQILAVLVLIVAIVNYTNLATAQSLSRAREVGLRKTMGATQFQLLAQFLIESVCIVGISMLITLALLEFLIPLFNDATGRAIALDYLTTLPWLLATTIVVGVLAGAYPAYLITRATPISALRESGTAGASGGLFRSTMLGVQFTISIFMLAMVVVVYAQNQKVVSGSEIYPRSRIITLERIGLDEIQARRDTLKNEFLKLGGVEEVTFSSQVPYEQNNAQSSYANAAGDDANEFTVNNVYIDDRFFTTYGIPVIAGRDFDESIAADTVRDGALQANAVINELTMERLGLASPQAALGHVFYDQPDDREPRAYTVVGVVPSQNFLGFHNDIKPMVFRMSSRTSSYRLASVRVAAGVPLAPLIAEMELRWDALIPEYPMQTKLLDETFQDVFVIFSLATRVLGNFAVIALLLSMIGLFGLAAFMAQSRTREIGIRKVMGAGIAQIVRLLVWQFSRPVLWSLLVALPLAYFASSAYLEFFADRIAAPVGIVAGAGVVAVLFSWAVVGVHAWRVARENPIRALRHE